MESGKLSSIVVALLLIAGVVVLFTLSTPNRQSQLMNAAQTQTSPTPPEPQLTSSAEPIPSATAAPTSATQPYYSPTTEPGVTIMPSPTGSIPVFTPLRTPNPTEVAIFALDKYLEYVKRQQPGTFIARRTLTTPITLGGATQPMTITGYTVEAVVMTSTVTHNVTVPGGALGSQEHPLASEQRTFDRLWRVVIDGGPFSETNMGWFVWIEDKMAGGTFKRNGSLVAIVFDRELLREGARIGLGSGTNGPMYLPEPLHFDIAP